MGPSEAVITDLREYVDESEGGFYLERRAGPPVRLVVYRLEPNRIHVGVPGDFRLEETVRGYVTARARGGIWHLEAKPHDREGGEKVFDVVPLEVDPASLRFENSRQFFRIRFAEPPEATLIRPGDSPEIAVRLVDLSAGGVRVECPEPIEPSERLRMKISLGAGHEAVALDQWCEEVVDNGKTGSFTEPVRFLHGLRFLPPGVGASPSELRRFENLQQRVLRLCNALVAHRRARGV